MTRTVYLNGDYLPETEAHVSIFDRGFVMGDAVYEVTSVLNGQVLEFDGHIARLTRSLEALNHQLELRVAERTEALNRANSELREANRILEKLAASDSLTELANRRNFFEQADAEV